MSEIGGFASPEAGIPAVTPEMVARAVRVVAGMARDAEDLRDLLDSLGVSRETLARVGVRAGQTNGRSGE